MHYSLIGIAVIGASVLISPAAVAQESADQALTIFENKALDDSIFEFSYASPNSPVLPLVGVTDDQITRLDSIRKFGVNLLSGLGSPGASPAVAIDFSPFWLFNTRAVSLTDYRNFSTLNRIVARTSVGMAASQGDSAKGRPSSFVVSLSSKLLDGTDRLTDNGFDACLLKSDVYKLFSDIHQRDTESLVVFQRDHNPAAVADFVAEQEAKRNEAEEKSFQTIEKAHAACVVEQSKRVANRASFDTGIGMRFTGESGRFQDFHGAGTIFWATWSSGAVGGRTPDQAYVGPIAGLRARAVVHARYTLKETVFDDLFALQGKRDALLLVGGIESAPSPDPKATERLRWSLQAGWTKQNAVLPTEDDKNYWRYQARANLRVMNGLWLNGTLGRVSGKGIATDTTALLSLSFALPSKASSITEYYNSRD